MKAMIVPRLPESQFPLITSKCIFLLFALGFAYYILALSKVRKKGIKIQNSIFINYSRCVWGQCSVAVVRTSPL